MKLQRYVTNDGVMPPGTWVKASDAEALERTIKNQNTHIASLRATLETTVKEKESAVERATANMIAAQNRVAELEKALRDIVERHEGEYSCDCEEDDEDDVIILCDACIAKKALEAKG